MLENLHKIGLSSIEKAPVTQPNIYSLEQAIELVCQASKGHPYMMSSNSVTHTHSRGHVLEITIFAGPHLSSFEMMLSMIGP